MTDIVVTAAPGSAGQSVSGVAGKRVTLSTPQVSQGVAFNDDGTGWAVLDGGLARSFDATSSLLLRQVVAGNVTARVDSGESTGGGGGGGGGSGFSQPVDVLYLSQAGFDISGVTDVTSALQAWANSIPSGSRVIWNGKPKISSAVSFPNSVELDGLGANNAYGPIANVPAAMANNPNGQFWSSGFTQTNPSANGFVFLAPASRCHGVHAQDGAITSRTAGSGFVWGSVSAAADGCKQYDTSTYGWWDAANVRNAVGWAFHDNNVYSPRNTGLKIENLVNGDEGDPAIYANNFSSAFGNPLAAIWFVSGGGVKITGNKINRAPPSLGSVTDNLFQYGILLQPGSGIDTSVFPINSNSIENFEKAGIYVDHSLGGQIGLVTVVGNEFAAYGAGNPFKYCMEVHGTNAHRLTGLVFTSNVCAKLLGLSVEYTNLVRYADNVYTQPVAGYGNVFSIGQGVNNVSYSACATGSQTAPFYDDRSSAAIFQSSNSNHEYECSANDVYDSNIVYKIVLKEYSAIDVEIHVSGNGFSLGAFGGIHRRRLTCQTGTVLIKTIGTDDATGPDNTDTTYPVDVSLQNMFENDANAPYEGVTIRLTKKAGSVATKLDANVRMIIKGQPKQIIIN